MNELQINKLNDKISYEEGKIYWEHCKGYTSDLIKRLHKQGYTSIKRGAVHILKSPEGEEMATGYSWEGYLFNIASLFI
jgi:hypothetical protein